MTTTLTPSTHLNGLDPQAILESAATPDKVAPYLDKGLLSLYSLIWKRFVASQMAAARWRPGPAPVARRWRRSVHARSG